MSSSEFRKRVLSEIMNLLRENGWSYIDNFPLDVLDIYCSLVESCGGHPTESALTKAITEMRTGFFRLNSLGRSDFVSELHSRISSRVVYSQGQSIRPQAQLTDAGRAVQLCVEEVDSFALVKHTMATEIPDVSEMLESDVKRMFAEIIGEPFVPKDSGSEKSDLFTSRLIYEGSRLNAAFLLKGRSVRGVMRIKDLGDSGNQVLRLLQEPADVYVVQHVNAISTDVIKHLRDQCRLKAQEESRDIYFCVIDGTDTARILRAYDKL